MIIGFFTILFFIKNLYCDRDELMKTYMKYIAENCKPLDNPYYNSEKVNIEMELTPIRERIFDVFYSNKRSVLPSKKTIYKLSKTLGSRYDTLRVAYNILRFSRNQWVGKYFQKFDECYYYKEKWKVFGDKRVLNIYFSRDHFNTGNEYLKNLDYNDWSIDRKLNVFHKIVALFELLTNNDLRWFKIAFEDIQLTKSDDIILPFYKVGSFTEINMNTFNSYVSKNFRYLFDGKNTVTMQLVTMLDTEEEREYILPELNPLNNNPTVESLERSDIYNLGLLFVRLFGLSVQQAYENFRSKCLIAGKINKRWHDCFSNTVDFLIKNKKSDNHIENGFIAHMFSYYMNLYFNYDKNANLLTTIHNSHFDAMLEVYMLEHMSCFQLQGTLKDFVHLGKKYDVEIYRDLPDLHNDYELRIYKSFLAIPFKHKPNPVDEMYSYVVSKMVLIDDLVKELNDIETEAEEYGLLAYILKKQNKCLYTGSYRLIEVSYIDLFVSQIYNVFPPLNLNLIEILRIAKAYVEMIVKFREQGFTYLNLNPSDIMITWTYNSDYFNQWKNFRIKIFPWKFRQISKMNSDPEILKTELCPSTPEFSVNNSPKEIQELCNNKGIDIKALSTFEIYKIGYFMLYLLVPPDNKSSIDGKLKYIKRMYGKQTQGFEELFIWLIEGCLEADFKDRHSLKKVKDTVTELVAATEIMEFKKLDVI